MCSKLTIKDAWRRSSVFIVNFEQNIRPCFSVSIVNFGRVITGWERTTFSGQ